MRNKSNANKETIIFEDQGPLNQLIRRVRILGKKKLRDGIKILASSTDDANLTRMRSRRNSQRFPKF